MSKQFAATKTSYCQRTGQQIQVTNIHQDGRYVAKHVVLSTPPPDFELIDDYEITAPYNWKDTR